MRKDVSDQRKELSFRLILLLNFNSFKFSVVLIIVFFFNHKLALTNKIKTGTSTRGPITPTKACWELIPNTAIATAMANSKLFPVAVKAIDAFCRKVLLGFY